MDIIFETKFGSHIYGTNTPTSDLDFKGIYQATYRDIILNRVKDSIVTTTRVDKSEGVRNKAGDIDKEYKELRRFFRDAISGQTYALDMLYTPEEFWIEASDTWREILKERHRFLSKSMNAFIGYIRQQTGKYGMKGTRMSAVLAVVEFLRGFSPDTSITDVWEDIPKNEFVTLKLHDQLINKEVKQELMLTVLEKMFQKNVKVGFVLEVLEKFANEYGTRSKMAMENKGVDWKAVSHAYRACYQLLDIANEGRIIFPLTQAQEVLRIKNGTVSYADVIQNELPILMEKSMEAINKSNLPDKVDSTYWDEFVVKTYEKSNNL